MQISYQINFYVKNVYCLEYINIKYTCLILLDNERFDIFQNCRKQAKVLLISLSKPIGQ